MKSERIQLIYALATLGPLGIAALYFLVPWTLIWIGLLTVGAVIGLFGAVYGWAWLGDKIADKYGDDKQ
jgi:hypothetical protein